MRSRLAIALVLLSLSAATPLQAGEFRAALGSWRYDLSGDVTDRGETFDFEKDLGLGASGRRSLLLEYDTPARWPDLAASFSQLGARGERTETRPAPLPIGPPQTRRLATDVDFDDYDLTVRVPLRVAAAVVSLGLSAKRLRGEVVIDDSDEPAPRHQTYDEVFPQLHAQLRWPLSRFLTLAVAAQGIEYQGSKAAEYRVAAEIRLWKRAQIEFGWQEKRYEITLDDYRLDARLDGALLRLGVLLR